jgi:hypothetical protein
MVRDGSRRVVDLGPWTAWLVLDDGISAGSAGGSLVTARCEPHALVTPAGPRGLALVRVRPRCASWMPVAGEPCARLQGHRDAHRTRAVLDHDRDDRAMRKALAVASPVAHNSSGGVSTAPSHEQARRPLTPVEAGPARSRGVSAT